MSFTDLALIMGVTLASLYILYETICPLSQQGKTLLVITLKQTSRFDALIFICLLILLTYQHIESDGSLLTTWLLTSSIVIAYYFFYLRKPKLYFKALGFYYLYQFIPYNQIDSLDLTKDGLLLVVFNKKNVFFQVTNLKDMKRIISFLVEQQPAR